MSLHLATVSLTGTGLGLYLSRLLAEAMSGSLGLEHTSLEGSVFHLDLPLAGNEEAEP